jgi:hypothetical protein
MRSAGSRAPRTLAFLLAPLIILAAGACTSSAQIDSPAVAQQPAATSRAATPAATCGIPPCDKYLTRSETQTLNRAITGHPITSAIVLHLVVSAFCGGIFCIWGEGISFVYIQHEAHLAAQSDECLRVHILPQGHQWQLVNLDASNQSPYCS